MTEAAPAWKADPLVWGHGPRTFEVFLEPTCPFSCRALGKFEAFLALAGEDKVTLKLRLHSQPWHLFSGVVVRCVIAASTLPAGKDAAMRVLKAVADHRDEFEFASHCGGPNLDATPRDVIARLEGYTGLSLAQPFALKDLDREMKWHARYARQNGIHVSPTFMVDGLVDPKLGSGDPVEDWAARVLA